ncbi:hypothetical protein FNF27_00150 [Cafeteria roenbergensis]|uniref:Tr-type G domain-containing protein n=1 Tax=Cafeteria roenbergensis TaxID=33653 RepID=A0A5A8EMK1_CAFRO|nr:hypothetical protein FNF27_00150 [Cafeteria roenbergensis]
MIGRIATRGVAAWKGRAGRVAGARAASGGPRKASEALARIRNCGIIAHIDAGKTTLSERLLLYSGSISNLGEVHDGQATMDFMDQERERGITIQSAATSFAWQDTIFNLIDTPGHVDFTVEVERSLRVLDGAVALFDAVHGVEAQSETVWRQARRYGVPRVAFANKLDREGATLERVMDGLRHRLGARPVALQMPLGDAGAFCGVVDLLTMQVLRFEGKHGESVVSTPLVDAAPGLRGMAPAGLPQDVVEAAMECRESMLEGLADADDMLAEAFMEAEDGSSPDAAGLTPADVRAAVRRITLSQPALEAPSGDGAADRSPTVAVLCGSAYKNVGVQPLMDAVREYLPSPLDVPPTPAALVAQEGQSAALRPDATAPLAAFVFKVAAHPTRGPLCYFRVYSGTMTRASLINTTSPGPAERPSKLLQLLADEDKEVDAVPAGQIGAAAGLKRARTGDTLCASSNAKEAVRLPGLLLPEPVFTASIEADSAGQQRQLEAALEVLVRQDPSLRVTEDAETGQLLLSGMGKLHLEVAVERLRREFGVAEVTLGRVTVAYREGVSDEGRFAAVFDRTLDGKRHWARVAVKVRAAQAGCGAANTLRGGAGEPDLLSAAAEPEVQGDAAEDAPPARGLRARLVSSGDESADLASASVASGMPPPAPLSRALSDALQEALAAALERGPRIGRAMLGVDLELDPAATFVSPLTTAVALRGAAAAAVTAAISDAGAVMLEPVMALEISTPTEETGAVLNDLSSHRRGRVLDVVPDGRRSIVVAEAPLAELAGDYAGTLRSLSAGEASYSMHFKEYEVVPREAESRVELEAAGLLSG